MTTVAAAPCVTKRSLCRSCAELCALSVPAALGAEGVYTSIDYPGAIFTIGRGISPECVIVGWYRAADHSPHGYMLHVFSVINFPGARVRQSPSRANPTADVVANYVEGNSVPHGYRLSRGVFTTIDFPGAAFTQAARDINARVDSVGWYFDFSGRFSQVCVGWKY